MMSGGAMSQKRSAAIFSHLPVRRLQNVNGYIVFAVAGTPVGSTCGARWGTGAGNRSAGTAPKLRAVRGPGSEKYVEAWLQSFNDDETPLKILAEARVPPRDS